MKHIKTFTTLIMVFTVIGYTLMQATNFVEASTDEPLTIYMSEVKQVIRIEVDRLSEIADLNARRDKLVAEEKAELMSELEIVTAEEAVILERLKALEDLSFR